MDNETVNNIEIGEKIRKWRKLKKMTQEQLARKIEMNVKSIQRYETDTNPIPIDVLNNIAIALNIGIDKLICEENTQNTSDIKLTDIEYIYYEVREINSLMLALEEGIFGDNWNPKMYMDGYTHVLNMVSKVQGNLEKLVHRLENKSID
jgi:phage related transcriptional regulator